MDPNISLFLYLLTGITIALSAINLLVGFQKGKNRAYLILGLIGLCVSVYNISFSYLVTHQNNTLLFQTSFFFFISSFALLPWFFCSYTGYCKKWLQWLLSLGMAIAFILLISLPKDLSPSPWNILAHIVLISVIIFGLRASAFQYKYSNKKSALLLSGGLLILSILTMDDIIRVHLPHFYPFQIPKYILPLDYFLIIFLIIMAIKLVNDLKTKYSLEKSLNSQEKRWGNLLEKVNLLVVGIDKNAKIDFVNTFFMETTGFIRDEIIGENINSISTHLKAEKISNSKNEISKLFQSKLSCKNNGYKIINWSIVDVFNDNEEKTGSVFIGANITERHKAIQEIIDLKSRLEEENISLREELKKTPTSEKIIGKSDAIRYVLQRAMQVAVTDSTVLLEGETGVGKELVANYIQKNSKRAEKPFIKLNCAAIPASLLESELFGHLKGSFTDAHRNKKGMVEMADGGTLLLDEIGEFPIELQPKLLRFLQEGEFNPLGSETSKKIDVRIIAATNRGLQEEIEKGNFRNDLYYRLYVYPITIPPLRNRAEDIHELADIFIKKYAKKHGKNISKISKLVIDELKKYSWPGNIRELENIIDRAVIVSNSDTIKLKDIKLTIHKKSKLPENSQIISLQEAEINHILQALKQSNWQIHGSNGAAEMLGINPNTLRSRIKKFNITKP